MIIARATIDRFAFDRATTVRRFDLDGRLHIATAVISKSNVCPYLADEIPGWRELGLQPGRTYRFYRDPGELAKAVATFNNLPVLSQHVAVDATDHHPELVIGSTGTDARYANPNLMNSLVVWSAAAIANVEDGRARELSAAYRYVPVMGSGTTPEGEKFDGIMTQLIGNHVAVIPEGRVQGAVIGDARRHLPSFSERHPHASRIRISA